MLNPAITTKAQSAPIVVHTNATDLVHIGQALMNRDGALDFLVSAVFNYPTLAEAYKVAGLDALNRLRDLR